MEDSIELVAAEADGPLSRESRLKAECLPWDGNKYVITQTSPDARTIDKSDPTVSPARYTEVAYENVLDSS